MRLDNILYEKRGMKFIRVGGLSAVKYGKKGISGEGATYHTPPKRKGIYAFIHPYADSFLWAWKVGNSKKIKAMEDDPNVTQEEWEAEMRKEFQKERKKQKTFTYEGPIWCHFTKEIQGPTKGSWVLTDTETLQKTVNKHRAKLSAKVIAEPLFSKELAPQGVKDPFKRGLGGHYGIDHLEVFIDDKNLGRIR